MKGLGTRELVGLAVLAVGLLLGFIFLDPAASESSSKPSGEIHLGSTPTPTPVVTPTATATPPPKSLEAPAGGWIIGFYQDAFSGGSILIAQTASNTVDYAYKAAPFPDVKDDAWSLRAEADFTLQPGRYVLRIEHEGKISVLVNSTEVLTDEATAGPKTSEVVFEVSGTSAHVRIDARDVKGPFRLKVVP